MSNGRARRNSDGATPLALGPRWLWTAVLAVGIASQCKSFDRSVELPDGSSAMGGNEDSGASGLGGNAGGAGESGAPPDRKGGNQGGGAAGKSTETGGKSGRAGEGGTSGAAADGGEQQGGNDGTSGACDTSDVESGGMGGHDSEACRGDEPILAECVQPLELPVRQAQGVAVAKEFFAHVFASRVSSHTVAHTYGHSHESVWRCFDAVPHPRRLAASVSYNQQPEVFVTTACGKLFARQNHPTSGATWTAWASFRLPCSTSWVSDVALSENGDHISHVYVADRTGVFLRNRVGPELYESFGEWRLVGPGDFPIVAAGLRSDGRQQVVVLDAQGRPKTSIQGSAELEAPFISWFGFDFGVPLEDVEIAFGTRTLEIFAAGSDGVLYTRREDGAGGFTDWQPWQGASPPEHITTLAAGANGSQLVVLGIGSSGAVYRTQRANGVWATEWKPQSP